MHSKSVNISIWDTLYENCDSVFIQGISYWNALYELALSDKHTLVRFGVKIWFWNAEIGKFWVPQPFFKRVTLTGLNSLQQTRSYYSTWYFINTLIILDNLKFLPVQPVIFKYFFQIWKFCIQIEKFIGFIAATVWPWRPFTTTMSRQERSYLADLAPEKSRANLGSAKDQKHWGQSQKNSDVKLEEKVFSKGSSKLSCLCNMKW